MDPQTGALETARIAHIAALREALLAQGAAVFSAHHNEDWGRSWLPSEICTPADFLAVGKSDVVCAVLGAPPSPGVLVELGWASALHKALVILVEQEPPQLVKGLHRVTDVTMLDFPLEWDRHQLGRVVTTVLRAAGAERTPRVAHVPEYPPTPLPFGYHLASA
jgi:nucleoside 2-deoxyribosyltransferase